MRRQCLVDRPPFVSLPIALGMMMAFLLEYRAHPPITRAMLGVLDHDDDVNTFDACERLGLVLTPLDDTIRRIAEHPVATS
ncbi:MAG: hypothetical protein U5O39_14130 [Gammaproteobacteria bacterium]|nr:hypothetical protein [Gammaproteobacteria bacterium]